MKTSRRSFIKTVLAGAAGLAIPGAPVKAAPVPPAVISVAPVAAPVVAETFGKDLIYTWFQTLGVAGLDTLTKADHDRESRRFVHLVPTP